MNFLKYITLGFEVFNAVTTFLAMLKGSSALNPDLTWATIEPVLIEIGDVAHVTVNLPLAKQIASDAVATINHALNRAA